MSFPLALSLRECFFVGRRVVLDSGYLAHRAACAIKLALVQKVAPPIPFLSQGLRPPTRKWRRLAVPRRLRAFSCSPRQPRSHSIILSRVREARVLRPEAPLESSGQTGNRSVCATNGGMTARRKARGRQDQGIVRTWGAGILRPYNGERKAGRKRDPSTTLGM